MSGFQTELVSRILGVNGHVTIEAYAGQKLDDYRRWSSQIRALPDVASATPVLDGQALLSTDGGGARGGLVRGISLDDLRALHPISDHIVAGNLADFTGDDAHRRRRRPGECLSPAYRRSADGDLARGRGDRVRHHPAGAGLQGGGDLRCRAERLQQRRRVPAAAGGAGVLPEAQRGDRDRDPAGRSGPGGRRGRRRWRRCCRAGRSMRATGGTPTTRSSACCRCRRTRCSSSSA